MILTRKVSLRLTEDEDSWLQFIALLGNCSKNDAVRRVLNTMRLLVNSDEWRQMSELAADGLENSGRPAEKS